MERWCKKLKYSVQHRIITFCNIRFIMNKFLEQWLTVRGENTMEAQAQPKMTASVLSANKSLEDSSQGLSSD